MAGKLYLRLYLLEIKKKMGLGVSLVINKKLEICNYIINSTYQRFISKITTIVNLNVIEKACIKIIFASLFQKINN